MKNFFITTPIYYVNASPHIGSVYTTIMCDIINKFKKLNGCKTYFLTGTDEHGLKLQQSAEKSGKNEQDFVDEMSDVFKKTANELKLEYNDFIRTTEKRHKDFVQEVWEILVKNDWLYRDKYSGWYCVSDEAYYIEDELIKDEKGNFKTSIGKEVEWKEEDSYFFRLSEFQDILLQLYKENKDFIQPESRRNEIISFIGGGDLKSIVAGDYKKGYLRDLSISRNNFSWGIKIPCDDKMKKLLDNNKNWLPDLKEEEKHVIYVWLDALFNYQSAIKDKLNDFWINADVVHIVGKDIVKFHTIYWPSFLIAINYKRNEFQNVKIEDINKKNILPKTVFAHGWWTNEGRKISKSFGNIVEPFKEIEWLVNTFKIDKETAIDYFKYFLSTEGVFGNDLDYSRIRLVDRINSELVNNLGNLIQRVLSMVYKNLDGKVEKVEFSVLNEIDLQNLSFMNNLDNLLNNEILNKFDFAQYRELIISIANSANDYMEKTTPWTLKKENKIEELKKILNLQVFVITKILVILQPLCPYLSSKVLDFLNVKERNFVNLKDNLNIIIQEPKGFFPRLVEV